MAWAGLTEDGHSLAVGCAKAEQHLCLAVPGMTWKQKQQAWTVPLSWAAYVAFKCSWAQQPISETPRLLEWAASAWQDVRLAYALRGQIDATGQVLAEIADIEGNLAPRPYLFPHQRGDVQWLLTQQRAMLAHPRGSGKSPPLIRTLQVLRLRQALPGKVLLIAPPAALRGWVRKLAQFAPELSCQVVAGTLKKRTEALAADADVYLIGWPTLRYHTRLAAWPSKEFTRCTSCGGTDPKVTQGRCEVHIKELNLMSFTVVVADESHRMQSPQAKQTRATWWMAGQAPYFWAATGTPATDHIGTFWAQGRAIDLAQFPAKNRFLDLYAVKNLAWYGGTEILGIRPEHARFYEVTVDPLMRRFPREITRAGQPGLLDPVFRYPEMTPAQARIYKEVRRHLLADIEHEGTMVPSNSAVRFGRLCQLASSMIRLEDGEDPYGFTAQQVELCLPSNKADDLMEVLEDHPGQLVVAANSPRLVALMAHKLDMAKITHSRIVGGMSYYQQDEAQQAFQAGEVRVCFITAAGAEAIDLFAASTIYFAQPDPVWVSREQKIGRVDRIGQQYPVKVIVAITPGTVEQHLYDLGDEKESRAGQLTRDADLLRWVIQGDDAQNVPQPV